MSPSTRGGAHVIDPDTRATRSRRRALLMRDAPNAGGRISAASCWQGLHSMGMNWASGVNLLVGLGLLATPMVFGTSGTPAGTEEWMVGALVVLLAMVSLLTEPLFTPAAWVTVALGCWLVFAPLVGGYFYLLPEAASRDVAAGVAIAVFASIRIGRADRALA